MMKMLGGPMQRILKIVFHPEARYFKLENISPVFIFKLRIEVELNSKEKMFQKGGFSLS